MIKRILVEQLVLGIASYMPGVYQLQAKGTGGTDSARYCYSVWLRHLVMAKQSGFNTCPKIVAELGPGDSIGIGLAALISGSEKYLALDVVEHANTKRNMKIFEELIKLFKNKTPIPGDSEWPKVKPTLEDYRFPFEVLDDSRLTVALEDSRIENIRNSIENDGMEKSMIEYKVPWYKVSDLESESVDMIYSQAVLEHVCDLKNTYIAMYYLLKPSGFMSHTIDFSCHGTAKEWNEHWAYSDLIWRIIQGRRPYLLNREPYSIHKNLINDVGFRLITEIKTISGSLLTAKDLAARFKSISRDDLVTSSAFIQAKKLVSADDQLNLIEYFHGVSHDKKLQD